MASKSWADRQVTTNARKAQPLLEIISNLLKRSNISFDAKHNVGVSNNGPDFISRPELATGQVTTLHCYWNQCCFQGNGYPPTNYAKELGMFRTHCLHWFTTFVSRSRGHTTACCAAGLLSVTKLDEVAEDFEGERSMRWSGICSQRRTSSMMTSRIICARGF
jgi:hypothetical protein